MTESLTKSREETKVQLIQSILAFKAKVLGSFSIASKIEVVEAQTEKILTKEEKEFQQELAKLKTEIERLEKWMNDIDWEGSIMTKELINNNLLKIESVYRTLLESGYKKKYTNIESMDDFESKVVKDFKNLENFFLGYIKVSKKQEDEIIKFNLFGKNVVEVISAANNLGYEVDQIPFKILECWILVPRYTIYPILAGMEKPAFRLTAQLYDIHTKLNEPKENSKTITIITSMRRSVAYSQSLLLQLREQTSPKKPFERENLLHSDIKNNSAELFDLEGSSEDLGRLYNQYTSKSNFGISLEKLIEFNNSKVIINTKSCVDIIQKAILLQVLRTHQLNEQYESELKLSRLQTLRSTTPIEVAPLATTEVPSGQQNLEVESVPAIPEPIIEPEADLKVTESKKVELKDYVIPQELLLKLDPRTITDEQIQAHVGLYFSLKLHSDNMQSMDIETKVKSLRTFWKNIETKEKILVLSNYKLILSDANNKIRLDQSYIFDDNSADSSIEKIDTLIHEQISILIKISSTYIKQLTSAEFIKNIPTTQTKGLTIKIMQFKRKYHTNEIEEIESTLKLLKSPKPRAVHEKIITRAIDNLDEILRRYTYSKQVEKDDIPYSTKLASIIETIMSWEFPKSISIEFNDLEMKRELQRLEELGQGSSPQLDIEIMTSRAKLAFYKEKATKSLIDKLR